MLARPRSYRFICVYREEARTLPDVTETWRGWVQMVPSPLASPDPDSPVMQRRWFRSLEELSSVIRALIAET